MSVSALGKSFYIEEQDNKKKRAEALKQKLIEEFNPKKLGSKGKDLVSYAVVTLQDLTRDQNLAKTQEIFYKAKQAELQTDAKILEQKLIPSSFRLGQVSYRPKSTETVQERSTFKSTETLHFPPKGAIISCLEQHPVTSKETNPYLTEKKIIEAVADFFADQDKAPMGVDMGVMLTMMDLNEKLGLPQMGLMAINMSLTEALKDCAAGEAISVEKK